MKKILITLLAVGILGGSVKAEEKREAECKLCKTNLAFEEKKVYHLKRTLNLSEEQVGKVRQIIKEEREELEKFFKEHKIPLKEAIKEGTFKKEVFIETAKENAEKMAKIKAEYFQKILGILDDKQKQKFIELTEKRFEKMKENMKENL